jgi:hypothetical protein
VKDAMAEGIRFKLRVLRRFRARMKGNESSVTATLLAGRHGQLTHSGTLTMTEAEWDRFVAAMSASLSDFLEVEDPTRPG